MQTVRQAVERLNNRFRQNYDPEVFGLREACDEVNDASRDVIEAVYKAYNRKCWLVKLNPSVGEERFREHDGGMVYNFGADYVVATNDDQLKKLTDELAVTKGIQPYAKKMEEVVARVKELGGHTLIWS